MTKVKCVTCGCNCFIRYLKVARDLKSHLCRQCYRRMVRQEEIFASMERNNDYF
jgi:hypothetical protein